MNAGLREKQITVLEYASSLSYVFEDPACFSPGEYKILRGSQLSFLAECVETRLNGRVQLIYLTGGLSTFRSCINSVREEGFLSAAAGLLRSICGIDANGFLSCTNLDLDPDRIFIDTRTMSVKLIYLPMGSPVFPGRLAVERALRTSLVKMMMERGFFTGEPCREFLSSLQNMDLNPGNILSALEKRETAGACGKQISEEKKPVLILTQTDRENVSFTIDQDEYVLGRSPKEADGIVTGSKAVGRRHCRLTRRDGTFRIEDLGSMNGTFLDGFALEEGVPAVLRAPALIRIADLTFRVNIKE